MSLFPPTPTVDILDDGYILCDQEQLQILYVNAKFAEWFPGCQSSSDLSEFIEGFDTNKALKRIGRRGYYTYTLENEDTRAGQPLLFFFSFKTAMLDGETYIFVHVYDHSMLKEKEALIQSHAKMIEKNNHELLRKTRLLEKKNEQLIALSSKLGKYLSPQVYNSIFTGEKQVRVETYRKHLTVFFSDIKGFTELTDSLEPEMLAGILNNYLHEMSEIAYKYGGTVDKFIGDGILIFFGDPTTQGQKEDALACMLMALEMRQRMEQLRRYWRTQGLNKELHIRMGINSGYCTVGNFGSENRMEYTVIGGQVNLASRLETLADPNEILISEHTYMLVQDKVECSSKGQVEVKGIARPIPIFVVDEDQKQIAEESREVKEEFDGFSLQLDLAHADKEQTIRTLRRIIQQLELGLYISASNTE